MVKCYHITIRNSTRNILRDIIRKQLRSRQTETTKKQKLSTENIGSKSKKKISKKKSRRTKRSKKKSGIAGTKTRGGKRDEYVESGKSD